MRFKPRQPPPPSPIRDLSDIHHELYDPTLDPELVLRVTSTRSETIQISIKEEARRRLRRTLFHSTSPSTPSKQRSHSLFSRATLRGRRNTNDTLPKSTSTGSLSAVAAAAASGTIAEEEIGFEPRAELERQRTYANTAAEEEESARRQNRQDVNGAIGGSDKEKEAPWKRWTSGRSERKLKVKERRTVHVNIQGVGATNPNGYERNKVRTSKYTLLTFFPKNLSEQFQRIANVYFLLLVILQLFPIFGSAAPQVAMLPLLTILTLTAIKDGVEDWRRNELDNGVNNSAVTRLGDWKNVNKPRQMKRWWEFWKASSSSSLSSIGGSEKVSKGVKRLRAREGNYDAGFLYATNTNQSESALNHDYPPIPTRPGSESSSSLYPTTSHTTLAGKSTSSKTAVSDVVSYSIETPGTARWERTLWKKLEVGDIVLLKEDDQIPADIVVLASSDSEGVCFVETKNLDGETNLKPRKALRATMGIANEEDIEHAQFSIDSEPPHANLYSYNGVLKYRIAEEAVGREHPVIEGRQLELGGEKSEPISINELLLRGCALRNTKWVIGLVLFTGADTKIMMNQGETPSKRSRIEKESNYNVIVNFCLLMFFCFTCAIADGIFLGGPTTSADFYEIGSRVSQYVIIDAMTTFASALILFQNIVPISLIITVELVKTIQAFFIYMDLDMYYEPLDYPTVPKTWNISDDLGQIEYIFTDKTGTLTRNIMQFQRCAVAGIAYGEGITESMLGAAKREGRDTSAFDPAVIGVHLEQQKQSMIAIMRSAFKPRYLQPDQLTLISPALATDLSTPSAQSIRLTEFWRALALCHTVLADRPDSEDPTRIDYKAESPDEAALVSAARDIGFVFLNRTNAYVEIEVMGQLERYIPLRVLEFNSSRKRMSTIMRTPENRILLICKGADSVIYERLSADHDPELIASTTHNLEEFSTAGLRTLCVSYKYVTETEFSEWSRIYDQACSAITDREILIERACEMIEGDLTILGATALEDKLQEGVPDAIAQLHQAGLKLWILTGDKLQTAIEIAFSCNLLSSKMEIMILSADSEEGARSQIETGLDKIAGDSKGEINSGGFAVVIDGETLRFALENSLKALFLELTTQCETVVCCRVSPSQKALTVKLVKDGKNAMTLAIGDGANDVAMIQEANIGVGIAGLEGAQASMSADYAFGQFRYLTKLLLVHGRWCNIRIGDMHANFFYKNVVWTLTLFIFQVYCNFDATDLYDYSLLMLFNLIFTSLPVAILGISDQDVSAKTSQAVPQLYKRGIQGLEYTRIKFFTYMLDGVYQSLVAFYIPYFVYSNVSTSSVDGHSFDMLEIGTTVAACAVTTVNLFVGLHIRYWTWMVFAIIFGSIASFHLWIIVFSQFATGFQYEFNNLYSTLNFWMILLLVQIAAIGPRFVYRYISSTYNPLDSDIIRELEVSGVDLRDVESNASDLMLPLTDTVEPTRLIDPEFITPIQTRTEGRDLMDLGSTGRATY